MIIPLKILTPGADPGGGGGGPLTPGFEASKLSIFRLFLIIPDFFFAALCLAYYFFNISVFFIIRFQKLSSLASLGISIVN